MGARTENIWGAPRLQSRLAYRCNPACSEMKLAFVFACQQFRLEFFSPLCSTRLRVKAKIVTYTASLSDENDHDRVIAVISEMKVALEQDVLNMVI
ncbi:hypothetical protein AOLI_G00260280 [Acnodon oligacanthus]